MIDNETPRISPTILAIAIIQAIFIIAIIGIIVTNLTQDNAIDDRDSQPEISMESQLLNNINFPANYTKDISLSLTEAINLNTPNLDLSSSKAFIRNDSLTLREFNEQEFNALSFIVDIPNLEQSYQVFYKYAAHLDTNMPYFNNPRAVLCLDDPSVVIYPNFDCRTTYPDNTREHIVKDYFNFISFDGFKVIFNDQDYSKITIIPSVINAEATENTYLTPVKSTIISLGISPELFEYHIAN